MTGETALPLDEPVAEPDVGEGPADHHLMVAATRSIGVEVADLDALIEQPLPRGAVLLDRPRGRDVVRGDGVAQHRENPGALDRLYRLWLRGHSLEEGGLADIGGVGPGVAFVLRHLDSAPA